MKHHFVILVLIVVIHYFKTENDKVLRTVQKIKNPPGKIQTILDKKKILIYLGIEENILNLIVGTYKKKPKSLDIQLNGNDQILFPQD